MIRARAYVAILALASLLIANPALSGERAQLEVFHSVSDATEAIRSHKGAPEEFELRVSNALLDPAGINMAIITDEILARDWTPNGYEQFGEFRLFRYRSDASN